MPEFKLQTNLTDEELRELAINEAKMGFIESAREHANAVRDEELREKALKEVEEAYEKEGKAKEFKRLFTL